MYTTTDYCNNDFPTSNDWMDCILKEERSSDSELFMTDDPSSPPDQNQDLFWDCMPDNPVITSAPDVEDQWQRSPFEMDEFELPDFPPPRLTCPLVPMRRVTPPQALPLAPCSQPQLALDQPRTQQYCPPQSIYPHSTTLLPQAQAFSLSYSPMPTPPHEAVGYSSYDHRFSTPYRPMHLNCDISRTLSNAKYSELFTQCGAQLLSDRHPQFSLQDINSVLKTGYIYFLKNVKTIVPRIGQEWRFISHVRAPGPGESSDRSYNLLGPIPLRCKVKEWLVGGDLWRMYHFVQGKTTKQSMIH